MKNNINTGNIVATINLGANEKLDNIPTIKIEEKSRVALAGGIFGYSNIAFILSTNTITDNTNYGLVFSEMPEINDEDTYDYYTFSAGIGVLSGSTENDNVYSVNKGLAKVYSGNQDISTDNTNNKIQGIVNETESKTESDPSKQRNSNVLEPFGKGTKESPYIISSIENFNYAYNQYTTSGGENYGKLNIVLNTNINLAETAIDVDLDSTSYFSSIQDAEINIFGNDKLLTYEYGNDISSVMVFSLINRINNNSQVKNLNILSNYDNVYSHVSILTQENDGLIKQVNSYGAMTANSNAYFDNKNALLKEYIAGITLNNLEEGKIELSNNYSLIQALSGKDAELDEAEAGGDDIDVATNAVNIGGIAGVTEGMIINSINYGALLGGHGGAGYGYTENLGEAKTGENGETGKDGTHGGHASVIGGVVTIIQNKVNSVVIGANLGIIIGGNGGKGGDGQDGENGGDAVSQYRDVYTGVILTSIADVEATWNTIKGLFVDGKGGYGGGGGAGGNGGNSIAGGIAGVSYSDSTANLNVNSASNPLLIAGNAGLGGTGGNGGAGGKGSVTMEPATTTLIAANIASLALPPYTTTPLEIATLAIIINAITLQYKDAGDGGGAGGTGYSGNSIEAIQNSYFVDNEEQIIKAQSGGLESDATRYGSGSQTVDSMAGEYGTTKNKTDLLISIGNGNNLHKTASGGEGQPASQNLFVPTISNTITLLGALPKYDKIAKNYPVNSWMELLNLLSNEDELEGSKVYKLTKDFSFGERINDVEKDVEYVSQVWKTLPDYNGTIDGGGNTIYITGSYMDLKLLYGVTNKLQNINIVLNISNFQATFTGKDQFISIPNQGEEKFDLDSNSVKITGEIKTNKTIPWLREKYGKVDLPPSEDDLTFTGADTLLSGEGSLSKPYLISSSKAFEEFSSLVNETESTAYYKLTENITLTPTENSGFVIDKFLGHLDGDGKIITLNTTKDKDDNDLSYSTLIGVIGSEGNNQASVKNLWLKGAFLLAGITDTNYGVIDNVTIGSKGDQITSLTLSIAGVAVNNHGTISGVTNNVSLISEGDQTQVAGITLTNSGKLLDVRNNGYITATKGKASGITITNTGLIDEALNNANITSGAGTTGVEFESLEETEKNRYQEMHTENGVLDEVAFEQFKADLLNGGKGNDAAGIAIYNYIEKQDAEKDDFFNKEGALVFGITNAKNEGEIRAGKGGQALSGGINGTGGIASGIVVYNIFETLVLSNDESYIAVVYFGYVQTAENKEVINSGKIINGDETTVTDEKLKIISVNEVIFNEETFQGFYKGFAWDETGEEGD